MTNRPDGIQTLYAAASAGDLEAVRRYVAEGDDLEAEEPGWDGIQTVLGVAAYQGNRDLVQFLLAQGANPNGPGYEGMRPLQAALGTANIDILRLLLDYGAEVNATNENGSHALLDAVSWSTMLPEREWDSIARLLIDADSDLNHADASGTTPLKAAVHRAPTNESDLTLARTLLEAGAAINAAPGAHGHTALMVAVAHGNLDAVRLLIEAGVNVDQRDYDGDTAWSKARRWRYAEIAALLEKAGAVEPADICLDLHRAILWGKTEAVESLLEQGADANTLDRHGQSALRSAISNWGKVEIVRLLLEHGADIHTAGKYGFTALMFALRRGRPRLDQQAIVRLLIECGADVSASQETGRTALLIASEGENTEIVRLLLDAGAEVNSGDQEGTTALMNAMRNGNHTMVALLLERGAHSQSVPGDLQT